MSDPAVPAYDANNIFARILRGEIPCHKIVEDEHALAFMDVMPMIAGHCLVIPKKPSRNLLDADAGSLGPVLAVVQRVANAAIQAMGADGAQIRQYNETAAGQSVFHLHFHILPLKDGDSLQPHSGKMADPGVLAEHARIINSKLAGA